MAVIRLGVTGTDTGVGKTTVTRALVALLRARGICVEPMKPVETGVVRGAPTSDADALRRAAGTTAPDTDTCPITFSEPLAPWVAGQRAGRDVDLACLDAAFERLAQRGGAVLVEGAGGVRVPVTRYADYLTLFARWRLGVVIVAANRLGALNHTLLTVQAVGIAGLRLHGVVLNEVGPDAPDVARATNFDTLRELLGDVPVVRFPWLGADADDAALGRAANDSELGVLLDAALRPDSIEDFD